MTNDVNSTFLIDNLDEIIYMNQPEGFIKQAQEQIVCKIKQSIYRLKHTFRSWDIRFDTPLDLMIKMLMSFVFIRKSSKVLLLFLCGM